ncbi:Putrescine importer PuuP [uncultured Eubacterium sp.]|uniref:APC family permease n=1 Tax=Brotomerdimonas butyrica TaxID=2981721 RepID=UPI0008233CEC|nr:APC family permease [Brotomerdimonas butyrica]MCU6756510.1 APC family permease [Brotomerdimonas butyrica]SCH88002.1 Putrescine importer PuuP [uncultured Eubacterium sp.]
MSDNTLKRTMKLHHLVIFGVAFLTPMIAYTIYGVIATASHGVESGSICFAVIAMLFTALSYGHMAKAFPAAGSTYTYTRKAINAKLGVVAGWIVLLGYVFFPMAIWLIGASYFSAAVPAVPSWVWLIGFIVVTSLINIVGVEVGSKINFIMVSIQVVIIVAFLIFTIKAITEGMGEGTLASFSPFYNPDIDFSYTVAGAAAACYCFLGFDALTTFTEDTIDPTKNIPRSIILTLLVCGAIFLVVTYFTHLVHPSFDYPNPDNAAYDIAKQVAPSIFGGIFLIGTIAGQFAAGLSAQASGARLLYAMGRDGVLPKKFFGNLNHKTQTPVNAIILTGVVALFAVFLDVTKATAYINFGGFVAFFFVNISVIVYYFVKQKQRSVKGFFLYLVFPVLGALLCLYLLVHLDKIAIILGCAWTVAGIIYLLVLTKGLKEEPPELGIDA